MRPVRRHLRSLPRRQRAVVALLALSSIAFALAPLIHSPAALLLDSAAGLALLLALALSLAQQPPASRRWLTLALVALVTVAVVAGVALSRLVR